MVEVMRMDLIKTATSPKGKEKETEDESLNLKTIFQSYRSVEYKMIFGRFSI